MDIVGGFHLEKNDGQLFQLVYHHPKFQLIPQTPTQTSFNKADNGNQLLQPLFLCPNARIPSIKCSFKNPKFVTYILSPEYVFSTTRDQIGNNHHVLPLFLCNNKVFDVNGECNACTGSNFGTGYYFCEYCNEIFHKECVESPLQIKTPYHPEHSLQLSYKLYYHQEIIKCLCGGKIPYGLVYHCTICHVIMHPICAMKSIVFVINQPKRHDHHLTLFPRQNFLICNICGLLRKLILTYICVECNFIAHEDCMYYPHIINISRHPHRISYISYPRYGEWYCGVCRKSIEGDCGAYTCEKCRDYYVHSRCALRKDVWDGEELEGVQENGEISQDARPFNIISEGVIRYFLHEHNLLLKVVILDDENKFCQLCVSPIFESNFYSCKECDFNIHETCANAPCRLQHALHPHPLLLKANGYTSNAFFCNACYRDGGGFVYQCPKTECEFDLDLLCAFISEPFNYKDHEHPLFLALDPEEKPICHICKIKCIKQLNCIKCDFIVCFKCCTLPYKARYKHDKHFLKFLFGEEVCEEDWCEVCELSLKDTCTKLFYWCSECCTTFHVNCLFGEEPYLKPGLRLEFYGKEVVILRTSNLSRPLCDTCKNPCQGKLFKTKSNIACSLKCVYGVF